MKIAQLTFLRWRSEIESCLVKPCRHVRWEMGWVGSWSEQTWQMRRRANARAECKHDRPGGRAWQWPVSLTPQPKVPRSPPPPTEAPTFQLPSQEAGSLPLGLPFLVSFIMTQPSLVSTHYLWGLLKRHHFWSLCQGRAAGSTSFPVAVVPSPKWACLMSQEYSINQTSMVANRNVPKKTHENLSPSHCLDGQPLFKLCFPVGLPSDCRTLEQTSAVSGGTFTASTLSLSLSLSLSL